MTSLLLLAPSTHLSYHASLLIIRVQTDGSFAQNMSSSMGKR